VHAVCRMPCLAYIMCLVPVIGASGYSDDIALSSWTLSRYRDPQKVHDSSPSLEAVTKTVSDNDGSRIDAGRLLQMHGPLTANDRSPNHSGR